MYATILLKSFKMRKARYVLLVLALMIGASIGSALIMVSLDVEEKVQSQLRDYGPNLVVVPKTDAIPIELPGIPLDVVGETKYISETDARIIKGLTKEDFGDKVRGIAGKNAFIYSVVELTKGSTTENIVVAGTWFDELININNWWDIEGDYPEDDSSIVIGKSASMKLGVNVGDVVRLDYKETIINDTDEFELNNSGEFRISGIVSTGSNDDSRIFGNLDVIQNLTNKENKVNIMHISAACNKCPLQDIADIIMGIVVDSDGEPVVEVTTVKQIAKAEMATLKLIENLVGFITVIALAASGLAVMTTMSMTVVERRKEIGLMKAIGAKKSKIALMFLGEGVIVAIIGGVLGFGLGILVSQGIGQFVFDSAISVVWWVVFASIGVSIGIVLLAAAIPVKRAMDIDPAIVLRGE